MKHKIYKKVVLIILDGFGIAPPGHGNAISRAETPTLNFLVDNFPNMPLQASGPLVGLPWGEMGNSEVGHLNIGAGRIVGQDLPRITASIQNNEFFKNPVFIEAIEHAKKNKSALHLMGLVSPGGVHSFDEHLYALLAMAGERGLSKVFIHMFTDGRDTDPNFFFFFL
jgi:2,3-bisphosphoglycerate-independent phosphoglycerate mutase